MKFALNKITKIHGKKLKIIKIILEAKILSSKSESKKFFLLMNINIFEWRCLLSAVVGEVKFLILLKNDVIKSEAG